MKTIRVILVDDEMLIRKLVRMKMDAKGLGIEVVGEYAGATTALEEIESVKPDLIISDICMPQEDGLDFSEECMRRFPSIKIILLTGYDNFDYARRSIKIGVFDYLLKPIQTEELNLSLKKVVDTIRKEWNQKAEQKQVLDEIDEKKLILRDIYLNEILLKDSQVEDIKERLISYGLELDKTKEYRIKVGMLVIRENFENSQLLIKVVEEIQAFFKDDKGIIVLKDFWNRIILISYYDSIPFEECMEILVMLIQTKYHLQILVGLSRGIFLWEQIHGAYMEALESIGSQHREQKERLQDRKFQRDVWDRIESVIKQGNIEEVGKNVVAICEAQVGDIERVKENIKNACKKLYIDLGCNRKDILCDKFLDWSYKREQLQYGLNNIVLELILRKKVKEHENNSDFIVKILQYLYSNIENEELTLNLLAEKFNISVSHLSRFLKKFIGKNYGEILSDFRLMKMLELLHTSNEKDFEIGKKIGITDAHYLSIWFKKVFGVSVTEYRKLMVEKAK
ncbi:MAG TPA: response regulator [Lachnospiraceae bacterium]